MILIGGLARLLLAFRNQVASAAQAERSTLPWLYLKGLSTGDFSSALTALLGKDAPGLSAATVSRLKEVWKEECQRWSRRDLTGKNFVYLWADGVHFGVRLEDASQCHFSGNWGHCGR